jgi:hypothetical protein
MWITKFPQKEGLYWFYGYRYGKISCGHKCEPELMLVKVSKCANGFMHVADGQLMFESEVEEPHFQKVILPELPKGV